MVRAVSKIYRVKGSAIPGPDYKCSRCGVDGLRLWRQTNTMLDNVDLLCAVCTTGTQTKQIAEYAYFHNEHDCNIGDLVPARPTPEGDTFWGHTSGDVLWWYGLPQYKEPLAELAQVRRERDRQLFLNQSATVEQIDLYRRVHAAESALASIRDSL